MSFLPVIPFRARRLVPVLIPVLFIVAGCAPMPDTGPLPKADHLPAPRILPLDEVLAGTAVPQNGSARADGLDGRAAALRARAAALRRGS